jgi:hypothetical protein
MENSRGIKRFPGLGRLGVEVQRDEDGRSDEGHGCEVLQSRVRLEEDRMKVLERMQSPFVLDGESRVIDTTFINPLYRPLVPQAV